MYTRIDELIWKDAKLKKISNESKLLFIYLLSCQHRNVLGLYNLPKYYVQGDLGYPLETVSKGLEELFNNGFITYDDEAETILVNNFLKYNPLENPNQVKGALKVMPTIPKTQLFYKLVDVIKSSENTHLHELKAGIESYLKSNGFERVTQTVTITVPEQEEEKEEEEEEVKEEVKEECPTSLKFDEATIEYQLANQLYQGILTNDPKAKEPKLEKWAEDIDKLIRLDERDADIIESVINFATNDSFWRTNILSANKLRQKFQQLYLKMEQGQGNQNKLTGDAKKYGTTNPFLIMEMEGVFDDV